MKYQVLFSLKNNEKVFMNVVCCSRDLTVIGFGDTFQITITLTHTILVDSSSVLCWTSPFVILGVSGLFCCFYSIFVKKNPVNN